MTDESGGTAPRAPGLQGPQKAAVLLMAVGEQRAAEILGWLGDDEVEAVSMQLATAAPVESATVRGVIDEAVASVLATDYLAEGGLEYARATLERSLGPERAAEILERLTARLEQRPFEFLRHAKAEHIALFLAGEGPQTAATVIAHLHARLAGDVLARLEPEQQADVGGRIAGMAELSPDVAKTVEEVIRERLPASVAQGSAGSAGGVDAVAQILGTAGRTTERRVLDELDQRDPALAEEIRSRLFTFEEIARLDDRAVQLILREIDPKDLALALRGAAGDVSRRVLANMSQRGAEMLREEIDYQPRQRRSAVEQAQSRIVAVVRRLEAADEITLSRGGDDDLL